MFNKKYLRWLFGGGGGCGTMPFAQTKTELFVKTQVVKINKKIY